MDEAIRAALAALRRRIDRDVALDGDAVVRVVRCLYAGDDDATVAASLGVDADVDDVVAARLAVGLFRPADLPATVDRPRLAALVDGGASADESAATLGIDPATAARAARTLRERRRARADGYRARLDVEAALSDAGVDLDAVVRETLRHDRETFDEVRD